MRVVRMRRSLLLFVLGCLTVGVSCVMSQIRRIAPPSTPTDGEKLDSLHSVLPLVRFECRGRARAYYGDMDFGCTIFHYCTDEGKRFTYKCIKGLKFNEMTTSCSAGYFGDCSHPEFHGPAGTNTSFSSAPVQSFQNIPVYTKPEDGHSLDDPSDYPEPFIQHYDPSLDLEYNYEYYNTDDTLPDEPLSDALPAASSNKIARSLHVKRSSSSARGSPMIAALSAFASLANIPFDFASTKSRAEDRTDAIDRVQYVDLVDRAFIARPPARRRTSYRHNSGGQLPLLQLPFLSSSRGKTVNHRPPTRSQQPSKSQRQHPHHRQNSEKFDTFSLSEFEDPSIFQKPSEFYDSGIPTSKTTPEFFRPSSLLTNDPDEFQPVTQASSPPAVGREALDLVRPYRNAVPHPQQAALSTTFQNFSPTPSTFTSTGGRFPIQSNFGVPQPPPRTVQTPSQGITSSRFPSTGNFIFQQPPIHPNVFNPPFLHSLPPSGISFSAPSPFSRKPMQSFSSSSSFGQNSASQQRKTGQTFGRPIVQGFGRPPVPQSGPTFSFPPPSGQPLFPPPSGQPFFPPPSGQPLFPQPSGQPLFPSSQSSSQPGQTFSSPFNRPPPGQPPSSDHFPSSQSSSQPGQTFSSPFSPPQPGHTFKRPTTTPQHIHTFTTPFGRSTSVLNFGRPVPQPFGITTPPPSHSPTPVPLDSFAHPTEFQHDRPRTRGQNRPQQHQSPFQFHTESPPVNILPQTENPFVTEETLHSPPGFPRQPDQSFEGTSAPLPVTSEKPGVLEGFDFHQDVLKEHIPTESSVSRPAPNQQQQTRRRPTSNPQRQQTTRGRPSRPRTPATQPPATVSTHLSSQDDPQFLNQFGQPARRRPVSRRPQPIAQTTTDVPFLTTPLTTHGFSSFPRRGGTRHQPQPVSVVTTDNPFLTTPLTTQISQVFPSFQGLGSSRRQPQLGPQITTDNPILTTPFSSQFTHGFPTFPGPPGSPQKPRIFQPGAFQPGAFQPGAFQPEDVHPGAFQPENVHPGAFQPENVHPGAFQPGAFQPGAFQPEDVHPGTFQPGDFQSHPDTFKSPTGSDSFPTGPQQLPNVLHPQSGLPDHIGGDHTGVINAVESMEEATNVILPPGGGSSFVKEVEVDTEPSPTTTTPQPTTGVRRPSIRRRPNIRNRLQTHLISRTTTPTPTEVQTEEPEYDYPDEAPVTTLPPTTEATTQAPTTRRSYRQRIRDRLNRLNSRRKNGARRTTPGPQADTATEAPRRVTIRPINLNNDKLQRFRNRLRSRTRGRLTTTEAPQPDSDDAATKALVEAEVSRRPMRTRRINNARVEEAGTQAENVLQVREIFKSDQDTQETIRLEVSEQPEFGQQNLKDKTSAKDTEPSHDEPQESMSPWVQDSDRVSRGNEAHDTDVTKSEGESHLTPHGTQQDTHQEKTHLSEIQPEGNNQEGSTQDNSPQHPGGSERGRRIQDPNFRARFREFLKKRKNRVSARYRTTEEPVAQDEQEKGEEQRGQDQGGQELVETPKPVIRERTAQTFEEQRKELRERLLANRKTTDSEDRFSRRTPIRPLRTHHTDTQKEKDQQEEAGREEVEETITVEVLSREAAPAKPQEENDNDGNIQDTEISRLAGFRYTQPPQEPEIITAPPPGEGPDIMTFIVSADLEGGKEEKSNVEVYSKTQGSNLPPPTVMIVKESGIDHPEQQDQQEQQSEVISDKTFLAFSHTDMAEDDTVDDDMVEDGTVKEETLGTQGISESYDDAPILIPLQPEFPPADHGESESPKDASGPHVSSLLVPVNKKSPPPMTTAPALLSPIKKSILIPASDNLTPLPLVVRSSKPSFNLAAVFKRPRNKAVGVNEDGAVTPFPTITMSTDALRLPLEMLLPL